MKKFIAAIFILMIAFSIKASLLSYVVLAWDANGEPELTGYNIWLQKDDAYTLLDEVDENELADPLHPQWTIQGLQPDQYAYFVLTAYSDNGESDFSNVACGELDNDRYVPCGSIVDPVDDPAPVVDDPAPAKTSSSGGGSSCFISTILQ